MREYRLRRDAAWEKRARCGIAIPDVIDGQETASTALSAQHRVAV
jgi:hypothetical protein